MSRILFLISPANPALGPTVAARCLVEDLERLGHTVRMVENAGRPAGRLLRDLVAWEPEIVILNGHHQARAPKEITAGRRLVVYWAHSGMDDRGRGETPMCAANAAQCPSPHRVAVCAEHLRSIPGVTDVLHPRAPKVSGAGPRDRIVCASWRKCEARPQDNKGKPAIPIAPLSAIAKLAPDLRFLLADPTGAHFKSWTGPANVEALGPQTAEALFGRAQVLLHPAFIEAYGLAPRQAVEAGIPVVCTDLPGLRESVGAGGIFVPPDASPRAWVDALRSAIGTTPAPPPPVDHLAELRAIFGEGEARGEAQGEGETTPERPAPEVTAEEAEEKAPKERPETPERAEPERLGPDGLPLDPLTCEPAGTGQAAFVDGLRATLGFRVLPRADLARALKAGHRVLVHGWSAQLDELADRHPRQLVALWHSGITGSDLMGEAGNLALALRRGQERKAEILALDPRDVLLPGISGCLRPVWSPEALRRGPTAPKRSRSVGVGLHGKAVGACKNGMAAVAACCGLGAELHLSKRTGTNGREPLFRTLLASEKAEVHDPMPREELRALLSSLEVLVHPSLSDTWPYLAMEAVYAGTPVVGSPAIAWMDALPEWAQALCVCRPATATDTLRSLVAHLLDCPEDRERLLQAQAETLDDLAEKMKEETAATLAGHGFRLPRAVEAKEGPRPHVLLLTSPAVFTETRRAAVVLAERASRLTVTERITDDDPDFARRLGAALTRRPDVILLWNSKEAVRRIDQLRAVAPVAAIIASWSEWVQGVYPEEIHPKVSQWIAVSDRSRADAIAGGLPESAVVAIKNGVDLDTFAPAMPEERARMRAELGLADDAPTFLYVGRPCGAKNMGGLLDAFKTIRAELPAARLVALGVETEPAPGEEAAYWARWRASLHAAIAARGLKEAVICLPPAADVRPVLAAADVGLLPSHTEGMPLAILETLACARPVVTSAVGGLPEIVPPEAGEVVDGDTKAPDFAPRFAEAAIRTWRNRHTFDPRAGAFAFDIRRTVRAYEETLTDLAGVPLAPMESTPLPVWAVAGLGHTAFSGGLADVFDVDLLPPDQVQGAARDGRRVLVNGWRKEYEAAVEACPGGLVSVWHSGWTGTDAMQEGPSLAVVLDHLAAGRIGLLWNDERDLPPDGAGMIWPVYDPRTARLPAEEKIPGAVAVGPHASTYAGPCKNVLASIMAAHFAGAREIHVSTLTLGAPSGGKGEVAAKGRAEVLRRFPALPLVEHERMERGDFRRLLGRMELILHPSLSETWAFLASEGVYAGTPVVLSPAVPWARFLSPEVQAWCVVQPCNGTAAMADRVRFLLSDSEARRRVLAEQRDVLDALAVQNKTRTAEALKAAGFAPTERI